LTTTLLPQPVKFQQQLPSVAMLHLESARSWKVNAR